MDFFLDNRELVCLAFCCFGIGFGSVVWAILFTSD